MICFAHLMTSKSSDLGRSSFIFESLNQLNQITSNLTKLETQKLLVSTSCLAMFLETDDMAELSFAMDFLLSPRMRMESKHLLVQLNTVLDANIISNKSIDFDVIISDSDRQLEGKDHFVKFIVCQQSL